MPGDILGGVISTWSYKVQFVVQHDCKAVDIVHHLVVCRLDWRKTPFTGVLTVTKDS